MLKRVGAFMVLALVVLGATGVAPASAERRISVDAAKQSIRAAVLGNFRGGIAEGSLKLSPCGRDQHAVRCRISLQDGRGRTWCGRGSAWPEPADGVTTRTVTRFHVQRSGCAS